MRVCYNSPMNSETQRARFIIWIFILLSLAVGAGLYWFWSGEYQGQAAEKINASKETVMTNTLIGYWTLDGSNIVWGSIWVNTRRVIMYKKLENV